MADIFETGKIGAFGDRMQMFGLGSKFDTKTILEANLNIIQYRNQMYYDQKKQLETEKTSWNNFKSTLTNFQKTVQSVKDFDISNKTATLSDTSIANVTANKDTINGSYSLEVSKVATAQRLAGDQMAIGPLGITETSTLNGVNIDITADMSLRDIAIKISGSNAGVGAIVIDNKIVMTSKKEGVANQMTFGGTAWDTIGVTAGGTAKNVLQSAQNAEFSINGIAMTSATNTITEVEGMTIEIKKETTSPLEIKVERNTTEVIEKMKSLISEYNKMIESVNSISGDKGAMQGERIPKGVKRSMSESIYSTQVDGTYMFQVGITLDGDAKNGRIKFDEAEFTKLFEENPEKAMNMISGVDGFSTKLDGILDRFTSATGEIQGETKALDGRLKLLNNRIERFEASFEKQKDMLVKKYAMFETMMVGLNSQNDYIMTQLGQFEMDAK
jgi:flagellar hook-associated protein 2